MVATAAFLGRFAFLSVAAVTLAACGLPRTLVARTAAHANDGDATSIATAAGLFECVSHVTRTYFFRRTIYMDFDEPLSKRRPAGWTVVDAFAKAVQTPKTIVPYESFAAAKDGAMTTTKAAVFAFLAEDEHLYSRLLNTTKQGYFVAVWTRPTPLNDVRRVFRDFWGYGKHVNVVGLTVADGGRAVNAYTYRPFSNYGCAKLGRPYLLDRWTNGSFQRDADLFSGKLKMGNMLGCPLRCVGNEHPPDIVLRHRGRGRWTASGVGGRMLRIVAEHMNFSPVIAAAKRDRDQTEAYSWYDSADVLDNITAMLRADEADLAFGWYSYAAHGLHNINNDSSNYDGTELAKSTGVDCLGWAVPYRAGSPPQPWTNYVYEFDTTGWLCIGSMFVVIVGVFYFFRKLNKLHRVGSLVFFVYHTTIDQPLRVQPVWCSLRTFMVHWLWYCMVINVAYKAALGSFMTVPAHGVEFMRMDQILDSGLTTVASPLSLQIMNATTGTTRISRTFMRTLQPLPPADFGRIIDRLVVQRDIAVFEVKRFMYYFSMPQSRRIKVKIPIRFLPGCLLRTHTTQFMFNGGSYLTDAVNAVLSTLFETGIVDHWITHLGSNKVLPLEKIRGRVLKLVRLEVAFLFLLASYTVAFAVFVGEICWHRSICRRRRRRRRAARADDDSDRGIRHDIPFVR